MARATSIKLPLIISAVSTVYLLTCLAPAINFVETTESRCDSSHEPQPPITKARASFTLPSLVDYKRYKSVFKKHYASLLEDATRAKLFLARAMRAFASAMGYMHRKSNFYLAVNQMSDWTPEDMHKTTPPLEDFMPVPSDGQSAELSSHKTFDGNEDEHKPIDEFVEIENVLGEIVEHSGDILAVSGESRKSAEIADGSALSGEIDPRSITASGNQRGATEEIAIQAGIDESTEKKGSDSSRNDGTPAEAPASLVSRLMKSIATSGSDYVTRLLQRAQELMWADEESKDNAKDSVDLPDEIFIDHRDECMFAPRDQGQCGSCYAFATIALYEWLYCRATGQRLAFSEQYIVDCGGKYSLRGCDGGAMHQVYNFVRGRGLELRADYPYRARADACAYPDDMSESELGYMRILTDDYHYVQHRELEKELKKGPLTVGLWVGHSYHEYGGGVHGGLGCGDRNYGHAILLIGSGREDNKEYWLFKNSFSTRHGEYGYYKLSKKAKACFAPFSVTTIGLDDFKGKFGTNLKYHGAYFIKQRFNFYVSLGNTYGIPEGSTEYTEVVPENNNQGSTDSQSLQV